VKLSGVVTVHEGAKPATTATVELHNSAGDIVDQVQVDTLGKYSFHLASGKWALYVWDAHGHRGRADVDLSEGEDETLDIDLEEPEGGH
jgi:hypothetical protein